MATMMTMTSGSDTGPQHHSRDGHAAAQLISEQALKDTVTASVLQPVHLTLTQLYYTLHSQRLWLTRCLWPTIQRVNA